MSFMAYYLFSVFCLTLLAVALGIFHMIKNGRPPKPYAGSVLTLTLLIAQWAFFLLEGYTFLPAYIANFLFSFIWIIVVILLAIHAVREFNHHRPLAYLLFSITFVTFTMVVIMHGVGSM